MVSDADIAKAQAILKLQPGLERDRFLVKMTGDTALYIRKRKGRESISEKLKAGAEELLSQLIQAKVIELEPPEGVRQSYLVWPYGQIPDRKPLFKLAPGIARSECKVYRPGDEGYPGIPHPKTFSPLTPIEQTMEPTEIQSQTEAIEEVRLSAFEKVMAAIVQAKAQAIAEGHFMMPSQPGICRIAGVGKAYLSQAGDGPTQALLAYNEAKQELALQRAAKGQKSPQEGGRTIEPSELQEASIVAPEPAAVVETTDLDAIVRLEELAYRLEQDNIKLQSENSELRGVVEDLRGQLKMVGDRLAAMNEHRPDSVSDLLNQRIAQEERTIGNCTRRIDELEAEIWQEKQDREAAQRNLATWRTLLADLDAAVVERNGHKQGVAA